eukprot:scaffold47323_cov48-Phaeocystis_antarctica.AAC.3
MVMIGSVLSAVQRSLPSVLSTACATAAAAPAALRWPWRRRSQDLERAALSYGCAIRPIRRGRGARSVGNAGGE